MAFIFAAPFIAMSYLVILVELDNPLAQVHQAKSIVKNIELEKGMLVIDVGCGTGRVTIPLAKEVGANGEVVATDLQLGMLEKTRLRAVQLGLTNIRFIQGEISETVLEDNKYDRAVLVTVLGEIPKQKAALQRVFNALKPGGMLSITEMIFDPHFQWRSKVIEVALAAGFTQKQFIGK